MEDFGVIVVCTKKDYLFAKGCCASIRYFMGDVPLCLLVDGDFNYQNIIKTYNAKVINKKKLSNQELANRSFGWGITKLVAIWESPFTNFLLLDSDTCVWGDMNFYKDKFQNCEVILDQPCYSYTEKDISTWFFDVIKISKLYPDFNYSVHPYVCSGVLMLRKNIFTLEEYFSFLDLQKEDPSLFFPGEMGFLNFMFFHAKEKGTLRVSSADIQYITCDFDQCEMKDSFPVINNKPVVKRSPTVLHFCGKAKPIVRNLDGYYTKPMTFFRKKFIKDSIGLPSWVCLFVLKIEDYMWLYRTRFPFYKRKVIRVFGYKG